MEKFFSRKRDSQHKFTRRANGKPKELAPSGWVFANPLEREGIFSSG
jgi:hypothetical protein